MEETSPDSSSIQAELSSMTFEELQKLKEKLGSKLYNEARYGQKNAKKEIFKRENKNRPREVSSKRPVVPRKLASTKVVSRDPRFDRLCGEFDERSFTKNYGFVSKIKEQEKNQLKQQLATETNPKNAMKIKLLLQRITNQEREERRKQAKKERGESERKEQLQQLKDGEKIYFKTKFEKKVVNLIEQYDDLKESGKLNKHIVKHKKKENSKNRKRYFDQNE